jgi:DnaK suppressor protein
MADKIVLHWQLKAEMERLLLNEKARIREILKTAKENFRKKIKTLAEEGKLLNGNHLSDLDWDNPAVEQQIKITCRKCLKKIDQALERLNAGTYGICKYCDKPISIKRLIAVPLTDTCVPCKEQQEKKNRVQFGKGRRPTYSRSHTPTHQVSHF